MTISKSNRLLHKPNTHGPKRACNPNHAKRMRTNATTKQMNTKKKQSITHINVLLCIAARFQQSPAKTVQFANTKTYDLQNNLHHEPMSTSRRHAATTVHVQRQAQAKPTPHEEQHFNVNHDKIKLPPQIATTHKPTHGHL